MAAITRRTDQPLATSSHIKVPTPRLDVVRDPSARVRQAVRDNNVPLLSRLQHKTDLRNTDSNRLTSLSWSAIEGSLEVFEWLLLDYGHDDQELSRDADNNTILHLLASIPSISTSPFNYLLTSTNSSSLPTRSNSFQLKTYEEQCNISLRMTELYYTLFPFLLDWSNSSGKTSLHVASQSGNFKFIELLINFGADLNLNDLQGNTPLHYASAYGHLDTIRVILENNNNVYNNSSLVMIRNFEGFTSLDFAYDNSTLYSIQQIQKDLYEERKLLKRKEERSITNSNYEYSNNNSSRIRSGSLSSSVGGTSNSNLGSGSYSSQPGRYIDQIQQHNQNQIQQQQNQPLPPLPLPLPLNNQGLNERSSSLPMSRLDSSTSQNGSISTTSRDPSIISKSTQRSNNTPLPSYQGSPSANPQLVLGRPTPPLQYPNSNPIPNLPSSSSSSSGNRPIINNRSPSMPSNSSNSSISANTSLTKPLPIQSIQSNGNNGNNGSNGENGLPIPLPEKGLMMGSVMRRANSAQTGFVSIESNSNIKNGGNGRI